MKNTARAGIGLVIAIAFLAVVQPCHAESGNAEPGNASNAATPEPEHQSQRRLVINVRAQTLELFENNEWVKSYRIAVGKPSTPTPVGTFQIAIKVKNPTWYGLNRQVIPPGKTNPVGTRWMGLNKKGYGIHGTNAPSSIGHAASRGCIRMLNREAEDLFARVEIGDQVEILAEPVTAEAATLHDSYRPAGNRPGDLVGGS